MILLYKQCLEKSKDQNMHIPVYVLVVHLCKNMKEGLVNKLVVRNYVVLALMRLSIWNSSKVRMCDWMEASLCKL